MKLLLQIFKTIEKIWILCLQIIAFWYENSVEAKQWLDTSYSDSDPSETIVKMWDADFN